MKSRQTGEGAVARGGGAGRPVGASGSAGGALAQQSGRSFGRDKEASVGDGKRGQLTDKFGGTVDDFREKV